MILSPGLPGQTEFGLQPFQNRVILPGNLNRRSHRDYLYLSIFLTHFSAVGLAMASRISDFGLLSNFGLRVSDLFYRFCSITLAGPTLPYLSTQLSTTTSGGVCRNLIDRMEPDSICVAHFPRVCDCNSHNWIG